MTIGKMIQVITKRYDIISCRVQWRQFYVIEQRKIIKVAVQYLTFFHAADIMHSRLKFNSLTDKRLQASSKLSVFSKTATLYPCFANIYAVDNPPSPLPMMTTSYLFSMTVNDIIVCNVFFFPYIM